MFTHYRTQGFFLKKRDFGEADQLFTIYTKDFGIVEVLGKAVRKIKSKLRQGAELFYLSEIEFIQGKTFKTLTDTILINKFKNLRQELHCQLAGYRFVEVVCALVNKPERDINTWRQIEGFFEELNKPNISVSKSVLLYQFFVWNLAVSLGYKPELYKCFFCHKRIVKGKNYFYPSGGSVVCQNCSAQNKQSILLKKESFLAIEDDTIKTIRLFLQKDAGIVARLKISPLTKQNLKSVAKEFISTI